MSKMLNIPFVTGDSNTDKNFLSIKTWGNMLLNRNFSISDGQIDDLVISASSTRNGAVAPTVATWNAYPTFRTLQFANAGVPSSDQYVEFCTQFPHSWKTESNYRIHVHFSVELANDTATMTAGQTVIWKLEYAVANHNGDFVEKTPITLTYTADGTETRKKHLRTPASAVISGAGLGVSHLVVGKLTRVSSSDTFSGVVHLHSSDFHIVKDSLGKDVDRL